MRRSNLRDNDTHNSPDVLNELLYVSVYGVPVPLLRLLLFRGYRWGDEDDREDTPIIAQGSLLLGLNLKRTASMVNC